MNFMRKKPPQPSTALQELFKYSTSQSTQLYDLEKNQDSKKAYKGWKSLHTHILYELDYLQKTYGLDHLTGEEQFTVARIRDLSDRARDNMNRLETFLMKEITDMNAAYKSKSIDSSTNINNANPTQRRMLKTLRSPKSNNGSFTTHKFNGATISQNYSSASKTAASRIWTEENSKKTSLHKDDTSSLFKDFSSVHDPHEVLLENKSPKPRSPVKKTSQKPNNSKFAKSNETLTSKNHVDSVLKSHPKSKVFTTATETALKASKLSLKPKTNTKPRKPNPFQNEKASSNTLQVNAQSKAPVIKKVKSAPTAKTNVPRLKTGHSSVSLQKQASKTNIVDSDEVSDEKVTEITSQNSLKSSDNDNDNEPKEEMVLDEADVEEAMQRKIISELKGIDENAAKQIFNEIVEKGDEVRWDDVAGLVQAKHTLKEAVIYPFLRPDLFSGLREPVRGLLLFGPPGTGKTMLAKAVATESKSTFFSISASSLTSKYLGESEKLVRALFMIARKLSPSIIFIDEIDSLLSARTDNENESSRRIKTEFLVQWNSLSHAAVSTDDDQSRVLVLAATNLPWEIDDAARRRFVKRQYIPLPEPETRKAQLVKMLSHLPQENSLTDDELNELVEMTEGFSGSDITALTKDAAMNPLRELGDRLLFTAKEQIRGLKLEDFKISLRYIRPSVSKDGLQKFDKWARLYGSSGA